MISRPRLRTQAGNRVAEFKGSSSAWKSKVNQKSKLTMPNYFNSLSLSSFSSLYRSHFYPSNIYLDRSYKYNGLCPNSRNNSKSNKSQFKPMSLWSSWIQVSLSSNSSSSRSSKSRYYFSTRRCSSRTCS